ncbi:MAG: hypothetical protein ACK4S4_15525 [Pyrinomonadaceae bacterium]
MRTEKLHNGTVLTNDLKREWSRGHVSVIQWAAGFFDEPETKMKRPTVNWSAIGAVDPETAEQHKADLEVGILIAKIWDQDTGRPVREVLDVK